MAVLGLVAVGGASALTTVTIGQTDPAANYWCAPDGEYDLTPGVTSGAGYVVPAGDWTITSWSTFAGNFGDSGGSMSMMVFRPTVDPGSYTVVAATPVQALTMSALNTFPADVRVKGGDLLGMWATGFAACSTETGLPGDLDPFGFGPQPMAGSTVTPDVIVGFRSNISATLIPTLDQQLSDLLAVVTGAGPGTSFAGKVRQIQGYAAASDKAHACGMLGALLNEVKAQTGKKLSTAQASSVTAQASDIRATLGC